jgi:hypothetical protein
MRLERANRLLRHYLTNPKVQEHKGCKSAGLPTKTAMRCHVAARSGAKLQGIKIAGLQCGKRDAAPAVSIHTRFSIARIKVECCRDGHFAPSAQNEFKEILRRAEATQCLQSCAGLSLL